MIEPVKITLDDYVLSGGGANGESYIHKKDPAILLKLYFPGKVQQPLDEMVLSRKVYGLGIPTPEPGEFVVTEDNRYGVRFQRIPDKISFARAVGDHPEDTEYYAVEFARMCRELHGTHVDTSLFESVKERYLRLLAENPFFSRKDKDDIARFIQDAPDGDVALHGDLQYGNAILSGDRRYFIDLGDFSYGHPYFDLGMLLLSCKYSSEEFNKEVFHMDNATAARFWEAFVPAYFGSDRPRKDIEEELLPYVGLKTLIIERDFHAPRQEFRALLEKAVTHRPLETPPPQTDPQPVARPSQSHLRLPNNIREIPRLAGFIDTFAEKEKLDPALVPELNLAIEEAVANVLMYAYPEGTTGWADIYAEKTGAKLLFNIIDSGAPFDPTLAPEADTTLNVEEREIGGLGILLIRKIMDSVTYRRENGKNILTMAKYI